MEENQFDTIYHEHFSYFSFLTVSRVFAEHGLALFDVEELPTHGGSLRIYGGHADDDRKPGASGSPSSSPASEAPATRTLTSTCGTPTACRRRSARSSRF